MLSNNYIVEQVYRTYRVRSLIIRMIDYSIKDRSCDDLEQYIYEQLLKMDNTKLNSLYEPITGDPNKSKSKLRKYISQIIMGQRNGGSGGNNTEYVKYLRIHNNNETFQFEAEQRPEYIQEEDVHNFVEAFIKLEDREYTLIEIKRIFAYSVFYKSRIQKIPVWRISKELNITNKILYEMVNRAKEEIKENWFNY